MAFSIRLYPNTPKFRTVGINKIGEEVLKKHRDGEKYCPSTIGRSLVKQTLTPFLYSKNIDLKTKINFMTKFNDGINWSDSYNSK